MDAVREFIKEIKLYAAALAKWLALAAVAVGLVHRFRCYCDGE